MINKIIFWTWLISLILAIVFIVLAALDDGTNEKTYFILAVVFSCVMLILLFVIAIRMVSIDALQSFRKDWVDSRTSRIGEGALERES